MLTKQVVLTGVLTLAGALETGVYMQASETRWGPADPSSRMWRMLKPLRIRGTAT
ncbi:MAG: hypothetical protein HWE35_01520 [Rhodobacteraceae bacterium]|nr:hypothetical protein [Paracoccaceae bacterium]